MKIPMGNFGQNVAHAVAQPDTSPISAATDRLGQIVSRVGDQEYEKAQTLARAKDETAYLDHTLAVQQLEQTTKQQIATGEIPYEQASQIHADQLKQLPAPTVTARDPAWRERVNGQVNRAQLESQLQVGGMVSAARERDLQSQGIQQLDVLGKLAGAPGADVAAVNAQAEGVTKLLRAAGLNEAQASKTIQDFKDRNWFNQATQKAMQSRESLAGLKQLEHELVDDDGFYAGKMDTQNRNAVLNAVIGHRIALENQIQHQANKREVTGERALAQMDRQIASGVPATVGMWSQWETALKGTSFEGEFRSRVDDEREVQQVLRQPMNVQQKYLQDAQAKLQTEGGTIAQQANFNRLKSAVDANVKLMTEVPLAFNANRTGQEVAPLDLPALLSGDEATRAQLQDRLATLGAMRKQYGNQVPMRALLPQEAQALTQALDTSSPKDQSELFGSLYNSMGDARAYQSVMQQIAPDSPVKAIAGMLAAKQAQLTTTTHWFRPDEIANSGDVSATMLQGQAMLDPSKAQKAADGSPKLNLYLPAGAEPSLLTNFQSQVGSAFASRPAAAENAFQAVKAYYVGRAAQTGRLAANASDVDTGLLKEAITASLGTVANYNGQGQVLAPWGMSESDFGDRAHEAFVTEARARGIDPNTAAGLSQNIGLRNAGDGSYYVTQGRNFLYDSKQRPIIITVQ